MILDHPLFNPTFNTPEERGRFLKAFLAPTKPIIDAMTKEERQRFINAIIERGNGSVEPRN